MKKKITIITLILIFLFPLKAYASTTSVEVNVDGDVKKGEEINILINMKGLESLYAASVNFTYDKSILNIVDITAGDSIKKYADEIMEIGGEVDTTNNKTSYSFTFLGDKEGINGDGTLAIITAEVVNDGNLLIGEDSINIKLVKRVGDSVENYDYNFIEYNKNSITENLQDEPNVEEDYNDDIEDNNIKNDNLNNTDSDATNSNNSNNNSNNDNYNEKIISDSSVNQNKDGNELSSNHTVKDEDENSNIKKNDINNNEVSNYRFNNSLYILILVVTAIVSGYYYYRLRKSKISDN